jgi:hypothetical protein
MADTLLEMQDLYNEALVRELIEKTKNGALIWEHMGGTQFHSTKVENSPCTSPSVPAITWDYFLTKSQVGNVSYKYNLDVKKDNINVVSLTDGPLPHTSRDSVTKDFYEIVEIMVLELDKKLKESIRFVQNLEGYA